ncbi:hypothetical protein WJX74_007567 [Apatococcus lobatus]|uniref:BUB1 N-terminal domain-containing protein n=1 Tax=Apatococcus lobatus TaxID=904363 RepID=A0AAW1QUE8_9CHLO
MEGSAVDWELVKENFQPLKSGRKTPALAAAEEPAKLRASRAEEQKRFFCDRIASYKGDDPIEAWLKFIQWTQETYKAGGPQAELISLLERCTRELQSIPKYKSDIRYLRVWIHYANLLPEPQDVFHFLKENGIGQEFALYYLAYATYLELRGNFSRADATFQAGLSRHAQPEAKLRAKCEEFQQRMARRIQRKAEEQALGIGCESEGGEIAARPALGALPAASGNRRPAQASGLPRPLKRRPGLAVKEINTGRSGLEVFVDEEFAPSGGPALSSPRVARANDDGLAGEGKWAQLETWEQGRKENVQAPSKWAGAKLKQKKRLVAPAAPPLDIPQDEELAELGGNPSHVHATPKATLRKKLDGHSEALLKDPLRLHRETAKASHQEAETSSQARQLAAPAAPESRRGLQLPGNALHTKQPTGCTPAALGYAPSHAAGGASGRACSVPHTEQAPGCSQPGSSTSQAGSRLHTRPCCSEEMSFEELRAAAWLAKHAASLSPETAHLTSGPQGPGMTSAQPLQVLSSKASLAVHPHRLFETPTRSAPSQCAASPAQGTHAAANPCLAHETGSPSQAENVYPDGAKDEALPDAKSPGAYPDGNQNGAMIEPSPEAAESPRWSSEPELMGLGGLTLPKLEPAGEDVTMATKEAFAAVNSMFGGIMPCYGSGVYREVEPTVTISTKAAFEALNSMFSGSLPHEQQAQREVRETLHATGQLPPRPQRPRARGLSTNQPPAPAGTTLGHPVTNEGGTSFHADAANPSSPAPIGVYEDTGLLTTDTKAPGMVARGAAQSGAEARGSMPGDGLATGVEETGGLLVYEDTALLGGTGQRSSGFMGTAGGDADETQGFVLYEDTALLQPPASPAGSCQEEQGMSFYEDTQFITKPIATADMLETRPDTKCLRGLGACQKLDPHPAGILSTAAKMQDDRQSTAMSCIGRQPATPPTLAASSERLQGQTRDLVMASRRTVSNGSVEDGISGESDSP